MIKFNACHCFVTHSSLLFFVMNTVHKGLEKYLDLTAKTDLKYYIIYELFVIEVVPFLNGK